MNMTPRFPGSQANQSGVAVTGYACRLPGAASASDFWDLMMSRRCAVAEIPCERWDAGRFYHPGKALPGTAYVKRAALLDDIWQFDPGFFGISPREAEQMDPQQRILLEVAWEALEHGFLTNDGLQDMRCGVFVGAASLDYSLISASDPAMIGSNFMTGNTLSIVSNRLSYALNLKGPSYTVDTACSSSFFALHQAVEALRKGEIDTAIVAGTNIILSPYHFVGFSRAAMLSPDGLCKAFDASANGYVRGEGVVAFILRREDTLGDAEPVRSRILGTGVNSDGRTMGLSMPSDTDQARLLRQVYGDLGINPDHMAFVEAHGTGTSVGDPIEARAIGEIIGKHRGSPLPIGSAKTNVGHLEAASGLVGLLKAQLALEHKELPPSLHFNEPNPDIAFDDLNLSVAVDSVKLPEIDAPLIAGVNSFGFGGANAHAVIAEADPKPAPTVTPAAAQPPLILSAVSKASLGALAASWRARLDGAAAMEASALISANARLRERHEHRAVLIGQGAELIAQLDALADDKRQDGIATGEVSDRGGKTAFVFCGNGAQFAGMGQALYETDAAYRGMFDKVSKAFSKLSGTSLTQLMEDENLEEMLDHGLVGQPLLLALQLALVEALKARGLTPDAVAGHSVGEVAAAFTAGHLSLSDACRLIHARASAMEELRGVGGMAAVLAGVEAVEAAISEMGFDDLDVAGDNSPRSSTISGPAESIKAFAKAARSRKLACRQIPVTYPYHGPAMEQIRDRLLAGLKDLKPRKGKIPLYSATTGALITGPEQDADYWWRNARQRVRFREAVEGLAAGGATTFVEISPRAQLQAYVTDTARAVGKRVNVMATLEGPGKNSDPRLIVARALAQGASVDEEQFFGPERGAVDALPAYPWNHQRYRLEIGANGIDMLGSKPSHPLLGWQLREGEGTWRTELDAIKQPWLADHVVDGAIVFPGAGFVEMALAAAGETFGEAAIELRDFDIFAPLMLEDTPSQSTTLRTTLERETGIIRIESRPYLSDQDWVMHARGTVGLARASQDIPTQPGLALLPEWPGERLYAVLDAAGLSYGPAFRGVTRLRAGGGWAEADLKPAEDAARFQIHPAVLDAAFHAVFPLIAAEVGKAGREIRLDEGDSFVPIRFGNVVAFSAGGSPARVDLHLVRLNGYGAEVALTLRDEAGTVLVRLSGLRLQKIKLKAERNMGHGLWLQRAVPKADAGAPVAVPAQWIDAAARLREIGLTPEEPPEPGAGQLITDAAYRRIAWEALSEIADEDGRLLAQPEAVAEDALALYHRLVQALEEDDAVIRVGDNAVLLDCPFPGLEDLTDALISEAPDRSSDVLNLMAAATGLKEALSGGLAERAVPRSPRHAPSTRTVWRSAETIAADLAATWPGDAPLALAILGDVPVDMLTRLKALAPVTRLAVSDPDQGRVEKLRATLPVMGSVKLLDWEAFLDERDFDAVIAVDALGRLGRARLALLGEVVRPAARVFAVEGAPDLGADMIYGQCRDWWSETLTPEMPIGHLSDGSDWVSAFAGAGFEGASEARLGSADVAASVIVAARPAGQVVALEAPAKPSLVVAGQGGLEAKARKLGREAAHLKMQELTEDALAGWQGADLVICPDLDCPADEAITGFAEISRLLTRFSPPPERVWIVAEGGAPGRITGGNPVAAQIWGMARVLMNEAPALETRLVDAAPGDAAMLELIAEPGAEREWLLAGTGRQVVRVEEAAEPAPAEAGLNGLSLGMRRDGSLDTLEWQPAARRAPGDDEIEIAVRATGLNFRDVMWGQRLLPAEALEDGFAGATLGMECAGIVARAGRSSGFEPGQQVIAFAPQSFASHTTVNAVAAAPMPEGLSFETGAALPTIFLTAHYALVELANLRPGEIVLIHGGAGGVGLAALQIAKAHGARVFATAGNPRKRELLRLLGAEEVFDSRSLDFVEEIRQITEGEGVDLVLNSLAGEAMMRSLDLVRPFGRFIELGKQDYYGNTRLGLRPFRRNISYFGVDADQLVSVRPELAERMFADLTAKFADGTYTAPPIQVFDPGEVVDAFRLMQKSDHIGKIVIRVPEVDETATAAPKRVGDGAWLITGGLGGLGVALAEWLVGQGVSTLWLTGRSGKPAKGMETRLERLARRADIRMVAADVADARAMESLIDEIRGSGVAFEGVLHSAMVLEDMFLADLTPEAVTKVTRPKLAGAVLLDRLTRELEPDHFVMFSSVAALMGNPGQGAYVAANLALESLAAKRRAEGLPGLAIGWGPIRDQGYLSREEAVRDQLDRQLKGALIDTSQVIEMFSRLIRDPATPAAVTYAPMRWGALAGDLAVVASPLFERVDRSVQSGPVSAQAFLDEIAGLDDEKARERIIQALVAETARILRQPESEIDAFRPMSELGFDSLMAVDLKLSAEEQLGISLPLMSLGEQLTIADLGIKVLVKIRTGDTGPDEDGVTDRHGGIDPTKLDAGKVDDVVGKIAKTEQVTS